MAILLGEPHDFVFDRRAVARATPVDLPRVHRCPIEVRTDECVNFLVRVREVADDLRDFDALRRITERPRRRVAGGDFELREIDRAPIESARRPRFEPCEFKTRRCQTIAHRFGGVIARPPAARLRFPRVHECFEERTRRQDDCLRQVSRVAPRQYADRTLIFDQQAFDKFLTQREVRLIFHPALHRKLVQLLVALRPRRVHRRPLRRIQHLEHDATGVGAFPHDATERIDLTHDLPLRHATDGRIATHLPDGIGIHREQARFQPEPRRRHGRLGPRMARTNHNDIERIRERVHSKPR